MVGSKTEVPLNLPCTILNYQIFGIATLLATVQDKTTGIQYTTPPYHLVDMPLVYMPSVLDFCSHQKQRSLTRVEWESSLKREGFPVDLLTFTNPTLGGTMVDKAESQWVTECRFNSVGCPLLNFDYKKILTDCFMKEFTSIDRVLCVDYENVLRQFSNKKDEAAPYIKKMENKFNCNKVLLITKSSKSKKWILEDFKGKKNYKTLFLSSSCMYFTSQDQKALTEGDVKWSKWLLETPITEVTKATNFWGQNKPPFLDPQWQSILAKIRDTKLKRLRGTDDAMLVVASHLLMEQKIEVCLLTDDKKLFLDFVNDSQLLPSFKCEMGFFDDITHRMSCTFGVRFYESPTKLTSDNVTRLIVRTIDKNGLFGIPRVLRVDHTSNSRSEASIVGYDTIPYCYKVGNNHVEPALDRRGQPFREDDGSICKIYPGREYVSYNSGWVPILDATGNPLTDATGAILEIVVPDYYYKKYLKYKEKYILLQQKFGL